MSWEKSKEQGRTGNFIATVTGVEKVTAVDEHTVEFTLAQPNAFFLQALALYVPTIYDSVEMQKHATKDDPYATKWLTTNVAAFGPYKLDSLVAGQEARFSANPGYWGEQPYFTEVVYQAVPDGSNRVQLLKAGEVDWVEGPTYEQLTDLVQTDGVTVQSVTGNLQAPLWMHVDKPPYDDVLVRRAVNYGIDRATIGESVFKGFGQEMDGVIPPNFTCYVEPTAETSYDYDPEKAQALLEEAGVDMPLPLELTYSDVNSFNEAMVIQLRQSLNASGFDVKVKKISSADILAQSALDQRTIPFFTLYAQSIVLDPGYSMALTSIPTASSDRNNYDSPKFTELVEEANGTLDETKRCELLAEAQTIQRADASWGYVWLPGAQQAMLDDIKGWVWHPDNQPRWADLSGS